MAISHSLQPLLPLLLSLFFLPAALGAFVNFTNCELVILEGGSGRDINVTSVSINPHPLVLGENATLMITANSTINITAANMDFYTYTYTSTSLPFLLHSVRQKYSLCNVTPCPVTPGLVVMKFTLFIPSSNKVANQSEYSALITMYKTIADQAMCVDFTYPTRKP